METNVENVGKSQKARENATRSERRKRPPCKESSSCVPGIFSLLFLSAVIFELNRVEFWLPIYFMNFSDIWSDNFGQDLCKRMICRIIWFWQYSRRNDQDYRVPQKKVCFRNFQHVWASGCFVNHFPEVAGQFYLFFLTDRPIDFNQSVPLYVPIPNSDREAFMPI